MMKTAHQEAKIQNIKHDAQRKASDFTELFGSPIGMIVLQEIKDTFDLTSLYGGNEFDTVYKAAQRDVVRWIEEVITRGKDHGMER